MLQDAAALPPLTLWRALTAWRFEPGVVAVMLVAALAYGAGVRRWRRAGQDWPRDRVACFAAAAACVGLVGMSFLGVYDDTLFWVRAVQNITLVMVVPLLLAVSMPLTLLAAAVPEAWRPALRRVFHGRAAQIATYPLVVTLVLVLPLLVLYLSPLYERTLRSAAFSGVVAAVLCWCGFVYFWSRLRLDPTPRASSYLLTLWFTFVEMVGDAVLGVVLWLGPLVAQGWYMALNRDWGPSLRTDQVLGAGVLWIAGDVVGMPFIALVMHRFSGEDARKAREIDIHLDEAEAEAAAEADRGHQPSRLWWEDDPQLAERFRRG